MRENVVGVVPLWPVLLDRVDRHPYLKDPEDKLQFREGIFRNELKDELGGVGIYVWGSLSYYAATYDDVSLNYNTGRSGFGGIIELNNGERHSEYGAVNGHTVIEIVAFCRSHQTDKRKDGIITEKILQQRSLLSLARHDEHTDSGVLLFNPDGFLQARCDRPFDFGADGPALGSFNIDYSNQAGVIKTGSTLIFKKS